MKLDFRQRLLTTTLLVGAGMIASPAIAQNAPSITPPTCPPGTPASTPSCNPSDNSAMPTNPNTTGPQVNAGRAEHERARRAGRTTLRKSSSPVRAFRSPISRPPARLPPSAARKIKLEGTSRTEDLINSLPQVFADQGSNVSNGASRHRHYRSSRPWLEANLVLINGKRWPAAIRATPSRTSTSSRSSWSSASTC